MDIEIREVSACRVVHLKGDVDLHVAPQVREKLLEGLKGKAPLLVELSAVTYMDSSGVACLVEAFQQARKQGSEFGLAAVAQPVLNVLKLARLDKVFPIHATLEERLNSG